MGGGQRLRRRLRPDVLHKNMWPFSRKKQIPPEPLAEHPDSTGRSLIDALVDGLTIHRRNHSNVRLLVSWQGQGGRVDSYHIEDAHIDGGFLTFDNADLDFAQLQQMVDINLEPLLDRQLKSLNVALLEPEALAALLEQAFVSCLKMRPFDDSGSYSLGVELHPLAEHAEGGKASPATS
jgi:hypothetical protein